MPEQVTNISAGKPRVGGAIFRAPLDTDLPTNATDELDSAFEDLGAVSDDGVTNSNSIDVETLKTWSGAVALTTQTGKEDKFTFKLLEGLNVNVLKAIYGEDNVSGDIDSGISVSVDDSEAEECAWVIDMITRGDTLKRLVIPDGKLTSLEDIVYNGSEAFGYGCEITAFKDSNNKSHYEYIVKGTEEES